MGCDLPLMESEVMDKLYNIYLKQGGWDAFVYADHDEPEPMCCIFTVAGLRKIYRLSVENQLKGYGMKSALKCLDTYLIAIDISTKHVFTNFNDQDEIIRNLR
ncbi:Molybdenum cofactor guanylyltransferase [compost metagenome]